TRSRQDRVVLSERWPSSWLGGCVLGQSSVLGEAVRRELGRENAQQSRSSERSFDGSRERLRNRDQPAMIFKKRDRPGKCAWLRIPAKLFTVLWNRCSQWLGIGVHDRPAHAHGESTTRFCGLRLSESAVER